MDHALPSFAAHLPANGAELPAPTVGPAESEWFVGQAPDAKVVNLVNELSTVPTISADPLAVANRLRPVLLQLARQLRQEVHPLGVTGGQVSVLVALRHVPGVGVRELAAREGVSPAAMSRHISRLVRAGLVRRTVGASRDRRRVGLELTDEAERVLRLVRSRRTSWLAARLQTLDDGDLWSVDTAIAPLQALLEAQP